MKIAELLVVVTLAGFCLCQEITDPSTPNNTTLAPATPGNDPPELSTSKITSSPENTTKRRIPTSEPKTPKSKTSRPTRQETTTSKKPKKPKPTTPVPTNTKPKAPKITTPPESTTPSVLTTSAPAADQELNTNNSIPTEQSPPSVSSTTTFQPTSLTPTTPGTPSSTVPARRSPCTCRDGSCLCCTGYILNRFNFTTNNRACLKVEYEPDEFEFNVKLLFNNRQLYKRKISGKNPQPICLPIRRIISLNACLKFSNVYMIGRNLHACIDFKGDWNDEIELFSVSFECIRVGADGLAVVKPEEGGGLPLPTHKPTNLGPTDYDDSARQSGSIGLEEDKEEDQPGQVAFLEGYFDG